MAFKVLLVDDSPVIRLALSRLLFTINGVDEIYAVGTLSQAMSCASESQPDFIVLDLHLPDGLASDRIAEFRVKTPLSQIAVLTNDPSELNRSRCLAAGVGAFFDKSLEFDVLVDVVRHQASLH